MMLPMKTKTNHTSEVLSDFKLAKWETLREILSICICLFIVRSCKWLPCYFLKNKTVMSCAKFLVSSQLYRLYLNKVIKIYIGNIHA